MRVQSGWGGEGARRFGPRSCAAPLKAPSQHAHLSSLLEQVWWKLRLGGEDFVVALTHSLVGGAREVLVNGRAQGPSSGGGLLSMMGMDR